MRNARTPQRDRGGLLDGDGRRTRCGARRIAGLWTIEGTNRRLPYARLILPTTVVYIRFLGDEAAFRAFVEALEPASERDWMDWTTTLPEPTLK